MKKTLLLLFCLSNMYGMKDISPKNTSGNIKDITQLNSEELESRCLEFNVYEFTKNQKKQRKAIEVTEKGLFQPIPFKNCYFDEVIHERPWTSPILIKSLRDLWEKKSFRELMVFAEEQRRHRNKEKDTETKNTIIALLDNILFLPWGEAKLYGESEALFKFIKLIPSGYSYQLNPTKDLNNKDHVNMVKPENYAPVRQVWPLLTKEDKERIKKIGKDFVERLLTPVREQDEDGISRLVEPCGSLIKGKLGEKGLAEVRGIVNKYYKNEKARRTRVLEWRNEFKGIDEDLKNKLETQEILKSAEPAVVDLMLKDIREIKLKN